MVGLQSVPRSAIQSPAPFWRLLLGQSLPFIPIYSHLFPFIPIDPHLPRLPHLDRRKRGCNFSWVIVPALFRSRHPSTGRNKRCRFRFQFRSPGQCLFRSGSGSGKWHVWHDWRIWHVDACLIDWQHSVDNGTCPSMTHSGAGVLLYVPAFNEGG